MKIVYEVDGNAICAHASREDGFTNIQEWPAGFGYTEAEAKKDLLSQVSDPKEYED